MSAVGGHGVFTGYPLWVFLFWGEEDVKDGEEEKGMRPRAAGRGISETGCERWTQAWLSR